MDKRVHRGGKKRPNIRTISLSLAAAAALAASWGARERATHLINEGRNRISQMMLLEQVTWEEVGATNLSHRVTKEMLWDASGLRLKQEMLPLDLSELERRLSSIPWIESLQIQKKLPSTIYVRYTTHHAHALGLRKGKLWSVASSGKWIAPLGGDSSLDLPVLVNEESLQVELAWLDELETALGAQLAQVHEVNFSPERGKLTALIELQYPSHAAKITIVASGKPTPEASSRLKRVVQYLIKNNILVSTLDLRMGKKVVVNVGRSP